MRITRKQLRKKIRRQLVQEGFWDLGDSPVLKRLGYNKEKPKEISTWPTSRSDDASLRLAEYQVELRSLVSGIIQDYAFVYNPVIGTNAEGNDIKYGDNHLDHDLDEATIKALRNEYVEKQTNKHFNPYFDLDNDGTIGDPGDVEIAILDAIKKLKRYPQKTELLSNMLYTGISGLKNDIDMSVMAINRSYRNNVADYIIDKFRTTTAGEGEFIIDHDDTLAWIKKIFIVVPMEAEGDSIAKKYIDGVYGKDYRELKKDFDANQENFKIIGYAYKLTYGIDEDLESKYTPDMSNYSSLYQAEEDRIRANAKAIGKDPDITAQLKKNDIKSVVMDKIKTPYDMNSDNKPIPYLFDNVMGSHISGKVSEIIGTENAYVVGDLDSVLRNTFEMLSSIGNDMSVLKPGAVIRIEKSIPPPDLNPWDQQKWVDAKESDEQAARASLDAIPVPPVDAAPAWSNTRLIQSQIKEIVSNAYAINSVAIKNTISELASIGGYHSPDFTRSWMSDNAYYKTMPPEKIIRLRPNVVSRILSLSDDLIKLYEQIEQKLHQDIYDYLGYIPARSSSHDKFNGYVYSSRNWETLIDNSNGLIPKHGGYAIYKETEALLERFEKDVINEMFSPGSDYHSSPRVQIDKLKDHINTYKRYITATRSRTDLTKEAEKAERGYTRQLSDLETSVKGWKTKVLKSSEILSIFKGNGPQLKRAIESDIQLIASDDFLVNRAIRDKLKRLTKLFKRYNTSNVTNEMIHSLINEIIQDSNQLNSSDDMVVTETFQLTKKELTEIIRSTMLQASK